jgi:ABC-type multidrug transport system fused ATPase/permease subunit
LGVAVLKNINVTIDPEEKIGIVGRTGSGKSTLLVSMLRIVDPTEGRIFIDGIDITKIGLRDLRSRIAVIPQEPVLFVGTVRSNLDPFNTLPDEELWHALEAVNMKSFIEKQPLKLEAPVVENGANYSMG